MPAASMRIALIGRWGAACGISLHTELLTDALIRAGHRVRVYAPTLETAKRDWHHVVIEGDPGFVSRVYGEVDEVEYPEGGFFKRPGDWLDHDIVIVEGYQRLPWEALRPHLYEAKKAGARLGIVIHYSLPRDAEPVVEDERLWDAIFVFDHRFTEMLKSINPRVETVEAPYPHMVLEPSGVDRPEYAEGRVLLFSFGRQPPHEYIDYLKGVRRLVSRGYSLVYRVVRSLGGLGYRAPWLVVEEKKPSHEEVYRMLRGSDIHLVPKWDSPGVVVSSTLAQVMYAGVATVVPDTRYFETIPDLDEGGPLVKYRLGDVRSLVARLEELVRDEGLRREAGERARRYAWERRAEVVAEKILSALG